MSERLTLWPSIVAVLGIIVLTVGCSPGIELVPVTGIVTAGGKPVVGLEVTFHPQPTKENPTPGPYSKGMTDSEGKFSLVSRGGEPGALVGVNGVGFQPPGGMDQTRLQHAKDKLKDLTNLENGTPAQIQKAKQKIAAIEQSIKSFAHIPEKYFGSRAIDVTVPTDGLTDHKFDLSQ